MNFSNMRKTIICEFEIFELAKLIPAINDSNSLSSFTSQYKIIEAYFYITS